MSPCIAILRDNLGLPAVRKPQFPESAVLSVELSWRADYGVGLLQDLSSAP